MPQSLESITRRHYLAMLAAASAFQGVPHANESLVCAMYGVSSKKPPFDAVPAADLPAWLSDHGINAVFVYPNEDTNVLERLKEQGIQLFQSIGIFVGRSDYRDHPEWRPVGADGVPLKPVEWYHPLSPNHPELRKQRLESFARRLANPLIDGVWLDFIRFPARWEKSTPVMLQACFSEHSLKAFSKFSGLNLPDGETSAVAEWILNNHLSEWTAFKVESIRSFVEDAKSIRDRKNPGCKLGLFGLPWLSDDHDNAIQTIVAQDFSVLGPLVDVISPMIYHRMIGHPVERIAKVVETVKRMSNAPAWPIVQAMSEPDALPAEEFVRSIQIGAESSGGGVIVFAANHVESEGRWPQVRRAFLSL